MVSEHKYVNIGLETIELAMPLSLGKSLGFEIFGTISLMCNIRCQSQIFLHWGKPIEIQTIDCGMSSKKNSWHLKIQFG